MYSVFLQLNTFQCVIATDGNTTFAIFLYNKIEWTTAIESTPAKVGFNDGMSLSFLISLLFLIHVHYCSSSEHIKANSHIGGVIL